jgi:hypothetical protein
VFDIRWTWYSGKTRGFIGTPGYKTMRHMIVGKNLGLLISRQVVSDFKHIFVTSGIANINATDTAGRFGSGPFIPLYPDPNQPKELQQEKRDNFSEEFKNTIQSKLGYLPTPEAIFYYIYAIFHSPTYRSRYAEFLKIDFPRVPLTSNDNLFRQLADYGEQLVQLHLMTSPVLDNLITEFVGKGDRSVAAGHPKYSKGIVTINKQGDCFKGVLEEVWNFYIGGYQVCHKWLKDHKERTLSDEDIPHYQKIVVALAETIKLMQLIDAGIPSFPIE